MVYCGKPSKGCATCRARKIRCDQELPSCGQCIKIEKECPGYRDMLSLSFRNESDSVIEKAKAKAAKPRRSPGRSPGPRSRAGPSRSGDTPDYQIATSTASTSPSNSLTPDLLLQPNERLPGFSFTNYDIENFSQHVSEGNSLAPTIHPSIEERGINYFFANFVAPPHGPSYGHFHYLHQIVSDGGLDQRLKTSIIATGVALLANVSKSSQLMSSARKEYTSALRNINAVLANPTEVTKDSTLISILVLAIFEATAGALRLSLKAWTQHINGAAALIKLRGRSQLRNPIGVAIFIQASSHLLISCVQRELPLPTEIVELRDEAFAIAPSHGLFYSDVVTNFMKLINDFTTLLAAIKDGTVSDTTETINQCLKVDGALTEIFATSPPEWQYESAYTTTNTDLLYDGYYDIYHDHLIAQAWNGMRSIRITLNQTIRSKLLEGFNTQPALFTTTEYTALFQICTDTIVKLRNDILHSVPEHLGYVNQKPFQKGKSTQASPPQEDDMSFNFTDMLSDPELSFLSPSPNLASERSSAALVKDPKFPASGGYFLIWPLFTAGNTHLSDSGIREYTKKIFRYIGEEMGIAQGSNVASWMDLTEQERHDITGVGGVAAKLVSRD